MTDLTREVYEAYRHLLTTVSDRYAAPMRQADVYVSPEAYQQLQSAVRPPRQDLFMDHRLSGVEMRMQVRL